MQINNLKGQVRELDERLKRSTEYWRYGVINWDANSFNYLAIGNSLTLTENWGRGACSTKTNNDYFGLVLRFLNEKARKVKSNQDQDSPFTQNMTSNIASVTQDEQQKLQQQLKEEKRQQVQQEEHIIAHRCNFNIWERSPDRKKVLDLLDIYLSPELDLITLQLGENVSITGEADLERYEQDLRILIDYIKDKAPKAKIILIDDFWSEEKSKVRQHVAEQKSDSSGSLGSLDSLDISDRPELRFADLSGIRGRQEYQSKAGTVCYMADGTTESVTKEAETHPGDEGFRYIADRVIEKFNEIFVE